MAGVTEKILILYFRYFNARTKMKTCPTRKRCHATYELAEEALIGAHLAYRFGKGRRPVGVYQCDECGLYHLTSRGEVNSRLQKMLDEGEIQKQKEANWWEGKFRKRH
ncbi:MAG TPA: hypothetical protein PKW06_12865 [Cyclobacteriaceae bacterium]|nr:hypothetical protein [Cyclobacteriaceae bacterium]